MHQIAPLIVCSDLPSMKPVGLKNAYFEIGIVFVVIYAVTLQILCVQTLLFCTVEKLFAHTFSLSLSLTHFL